MLITEDYQDCNLKNIILLISMQKKEEQDKIIRGIDRTNDAFRVITFLCRPT